MRNKFFVLVFSMLAAILVCGNVYADPAKLTVMLYLCGTDLETDQGSASYNLNEIGQTVPNPAVNFVVATGGTEQWHADEEDYPYVGITIDSKHNQYWKYDEKGFTLSQTLDKAYDMTEPETLSAFMRWAQENSPAERYVLVLWDHGGGSNGGLFVDQNFPESPSMSVAELGSALKESGIHLDTLIIDACLMANLATAMAVEPYTDYLVASEEIAPGNGSAFQEWVQYFYDQPDYAAPHFGRFFCDTMQQKYNELGLTQTIDTATYAMIDLSKINAVADAVRAYLKEVSALLSNVDDFSTFAYFVRFTEGYGFTDINMRDLGDLAYKSKNAGISNEAIYNLTNAITDAVISDTKGSGRSYGHGLSFYYYPEAGNEDLDLYAHNCTIPEYVAFLDAINPDWQAPDFIYEQTARLPEIDPAQYTIESRLETVDNGAHTALHITSGKAAVLSVDFRIFALSDDYEYAYMFGTGFNVDGDFETGEFVERFDGSWPALDGNFLDMELSDETESATFYNVPIVLYYSNDGEYFKSGEDGEDPVFTYDTEEDLYLRIGNIHGINELVALGYDEETAAEIGGVYELYGLWDGYDSNTGIRNRNVVPMESLRGMYMAVKQPILNLETGEFDFNYVSDPILIDENLEILEYYFTDGDYLFTYEIKDVFGKLTLTDSVLLTMTDTVPSYMLLEE